jgi:hypothetical protein
MITRIFLFSILFVTTSFAYAQKMSQKIGNNPTVIDPSAALEVESTAKGLLLPRLTTSQRTSIDSPAKGLQVYDTNFNKIYFFNGTSWITIAEGYPWSIQGNSGLKSNTNFIGTTDTVNLVTKTNNIERMRVTSLGNIGIGTSSPKALLDVAGNALINGVTAGIGVGNIASNTVFGKSALNSNTTGSSNVVIGLNALFENKIGDSNTGVGLGALQSSKAGTNGVAIGYNSQINANSTATAWDNTNTSVGAQALKGSNTAANNTGVANTAIGRDTMLNNDSGSNNVAVGKDALLANSSGSANTAIGASALVSNTTAANNTALGFQALFSNTTGSPNNAIGNYALRLNTIGNNNVAMGHNALQTNTSGNNNTALGYSALNSNTTASGNVAIGLNALFENTTGNSNTGVGQGVLQSSRAGTNGVAIGYNSQFNANSKASAWDNTNTSVGTQALRGSNTPANNTGLINTAIGRDSMINNSSGSNNVALGGYALQNNTSGSENVVIGSSAGLSSTTGTGNIIIGYLSESSSATVNNECTIGRNGMNYRIFGTWTNASDRRYKNTITPINLGLDLVSKLKPVSYFYNNNELNQKSYGFIAQDVQQALKELNRNEKDGIVKIMEQKDQYLGLNYEEFVPILTKAIQEQQAIIQALQKEVNSLKEKLK